MTEYMSIKFLSLSIRKRADQLTTAESFDCMSPEIIVQNGFISIGSFAPEATGEAEESQHSAGA